MNIFYEIVKRNTDKTIETALGMRYKNGVTDKSFSKQ